MGAQCKSVHPVNGCRCGLPEGHTFSHQNGTKSNPWELNAQEQSNVFMQHNDGDICFCSFCISYRQSEREKNGNHESQG